MEAEVCGAVPGSADAAGRRDGGDRPGRAPGPARGASAAGSGSYRFRSDAGGQCLQPHRRNRRAVLLAVVLRDGDARGMVHHARNAGLCADSRVDSRYHGGVFLLQYDPYPLPHIHGGHRIDQPGLYHRIPGSDLLQPEYRSWRGHRLASDGHPPGTDVSAAAGYRQGICSAHIQGHVALPSRQAPSPPQAPRAGPDPPAVHPHLFRPAGLHLRNQLPPSGGQYQHSGSRRPRLHASVHPRDRRLGTQARGCQANGKETGKWKLITKARTGPGSCHISPAGPASASPSGNSRNPPGPIP